MVNEFADFNMLKESLGATDGNIASHIKALEREKYITIHKSFVGKKPNTKYYSTQLGKEEFKKHINALEKILNIK
jgi:DNA-binding PadR family transcriptional regulator